MSITVALVLHPPDLRNFDHLTVSSHRTRVYACTVQYNSHEVKRSGYRVHISVPLPALDADIPSSSPPRYGQVTVHLLAQK